MKTTLKFPKSERVKGYEIGLISQDEMEEIIKHNVNIQICLASYFLFNSTLDDPNERVCTDLGFATDDIVQEIDLFKKLFPIFYLVALPDNKGVYCQLASMSMESGAMDVFCELRKKGQINEWVKYFILREFRDDCFGIVYDRYWYRPHKSIQNIVLGEQVDKIKSDSFFQWFLDENRNCFGYKIILSGFKLEEIWKDEMILSFSKLVDSLYVEIIDGHKFLNWKRSDTISLN